MGVCVFFFSSLSLCVVQVVFIDRQIRFLETLVLGRCLRGKEKDKENDTDDDDGDNTTTATTNNTNNASLVVVVPDSLAMMETNDVGNKTTRGTRDPAGGGGGGLGSVGRTPPKKKQKKGNGGGDDDGGETMVVTNTQLTSSPPTNGSCESHGRLRGTKRSSSRSPLMDATQNTNSRNTTTPMAWTNQMPDPPPSSFQLHQDASGEFQGRSLSSTAEFREAEKMAFMSSQKRRKWRTSSVDASEKDADADDADVKDINVNAYGETIRVADTLAMNTEYNKVTPTTRTKRMNTPSKKRVDFRFGDRQTEEQEVEENAKVLEDRIVDISATPIRETAPAPSGMHVNEKEDNDDDIEAEVFVDAQEGNEDQNEFKLPLREIFRAKHLIDPRDGSQLAPISNVQVLRDESFTTSADEKYRHRYDHFLACEIDHEIRDATEISVWKIEENCGCDSGSGSGRGRGNSSSSSDNSRSNDERASMKNDSSFKSSFKGTVLIGKPSARDGTSTSGISSKKIKRWAYSIAPNGLVFTSAYTKSSLFSMDETERTHESSEDEEDEEEFSLRGITERAFPTKSGVYVHDPVDVNKKIHASSSAEKSRRRSSGRRRSSTRGASTMGTSFPEVKKKPTTTTTTTYFELQSPGMAGKVHPREFASAFSEEYDETVFRLAGVGAEGKCRLWTWSCDEEGDDAFDDDDKKSKKKKKKKKRNKTKFSTAKICAKSVTSCKDFEIPTYKSHCVSRECEITSLSFSKDGNILACVFDRKHVVVWDASTTRVIFSYYCTEYEIEKDGLRVLSDVKETKKMKTRKSTPRRRGSSGLKSSSGHTTDAPDPIFFFGNFRKILPPGDSEDDDKTKSSNVFSLATFACAYNKELVVGRNALWETPKNGDLVSSVAVCPDVFVEKTDDADDFEDDDGKIEQKEEERDKNEKRNTTVNVIVTNTGRLGVFEAFGHANETTGRYEGLTFSKRNVFDDEDVRRGRKTAKIKGRNFLCSSHGDVFAIARRHPGCVSVFAQK